MKRLYQDLEVKDASLREREVPKLRVTIKYGTLESTCEGSAEEALKFVMRFIREVHPHYEIVSGLVITADLEELLRRLKGVIAFLPKGQPVILKPVKDLTDSDLILTYLVAAHAATQMGIGDKDYLSMADLMDRTGKSGGTIAGRLSELRNTLCVERVGRGEYKVTDYGIKVFMEQVLPKLEGSK